jgi:hypothetical protein
MTSIDRNGITMTEGLLQTHPLATAFLLSPPCNGIREALYICF